MKTRNQSNAHNTFRTQYAGLVGAMALTFSAAGLPMQSLAANPGSATTSTGQPLHIEITSPAHGSSASAGGMLEVDGKVSLGSPIRNRTSVVYVVDVSASTTFPSNINDCNNDGDEGTAGDDFATNDRVNDNVIGSVLDCEAAGVMSLNDSLGSNNKVHVGMVVFGAKGKTAMNFASPPDRDSDNNGVADIDDYLINIHEGAEGVGYSTDFSDALDAMVALFETRPASNKRIAYFLTDGATQSLKASSLNAANAAGITVHTYAIGDAAEDCVQSARIQQIADGTGGTCTEVDDPSALSTILSTQGNSAPPGIDRVRIRVNGGPRMNATVDSIGDFSLTEPASMLSSGSNTITAEVTADDGTIASADVTVTMTGSSAQCNGKAVTVDLASGDVPTSGDDVILGTSGPDQINARGGNDTICARGGSDVIDGGSGRDWIDAGGGWDTIKGGPGADQIFGGGGRENIRGDSGRDYIEGGGGKDTLYGNSGNDELIGDAGNDTCKGGSGNDTIDCETEL